MRKILIWSASIIGILAVGTYVVLNNVVNYDISHKNDSKPLSASAPKQGTKEEIEQQTGNIGNSKNDTGLSILVLCNNTH